MADQPNIPDGEGRRGVFIAAARLLSYPDPAMWTLLPEIEAYLRELPSRSPVTALVAVAIRLRETDIIEAEARYVATFDFNEAAALYLTAHELGDSRRRGQSLVELRTLLRASSFEEATEELPDYLPLLLEFLAHVTVPVTPTNPTNAPDPMGALERRLAAVCDRIGTHVDADNPYRGVFIALREILPEPAEANPERRFTQREQADTGEMPYPIRYD